MAGTKSEEWLGWMKALLAMISVGLISIAAYAFSIRSDSNSLAVGSLGVLLAGGCLLIGALVGFLFGIPRSLLHEGDAANGEKNQVAGRYRPNTNLEQISDWLTKILVGVGLTQMAQIPNYLRDGAAYLASALGNKPSSAPLGLWVILYFSACGFLVGYLWTRLFLTRALAEADVSAIIVAEVQKAQKDQSQIDAEALSLTYRYLRLDTKPEEFNIDQLKKAIKAAQASVRVQIFYQAEKIRSENWKLNKDLMERTIPIFQALVDSDERGEFHRNYAQLGFALKDKQKPEYAKAEQALEKAIQMRGEEQKADWLVYEANRAICRIAQDANFAERKESDAAAKEKILTDLTAAYEDEFCRERIFKGSNRDERIADWLRLNKAKLADDFP